MHTAWDNPQFRSFFTASSWSLRHMPPPSEGSCWARIHAVWLNVIPKTWPRQPTFTRCHQNAVQVPQEHQSKAARMPQPDVAGREAGNFISCHMPDANAVAISAVQVQRAMIIKSWTDATMPTRSNAFSTPNPPALAMDAHSKRATCRVERACNWPFMCSESERSQKERRGKACGKGQARCGGGARAYKKFCSLAVAPSVCALSLRKCEFDLLWTCNAAYAQYFCYQPPSQGGQLNKSNKNT